jgi:isopenicillin-N epimerase
VISHGANSTRTDRSRFRLEFDWTGTHDPTPYLAVPEAIRFLGGLLPGGWPAIMEANRRLALGARATLSGALGISPPCPEEMVGALVAVPLPGKGNPPGNAGPGPDSLQQVLFDRHGFELLVYSWPALAARLLRVSAQLYNTSAEYERLAGCLKALAQA